MKHLKYLKTYSTILFIVILTSCSSASENEPGDLKDILPSSNKYAEEKLTDTVRVYQEPLHSHDDFTFLDTVLYEQFPQLKSVLNVTPNRFFIDRLNPQSKLSKSISIDSVAVAFIVWEFKDSIQTENAFFNWLDNFGEEQDVIRVGEIFKYKETGNYIYVGKDKLVFVSSSEMFNFSPFKSLIEKVYGKEWKYSVHQPKGQRAKWLVLPEDVKNSEL